MPLHDVQLGAVRQRRLAPRRDLGHRIGRRLRNGGAVEGRLERLLRGQRRREQRERGDARDVQVLHDQSPPFFGPVTIVLSPAFDALSVWPGGTTLRTMRPLVRYFAATRFT